MKENQLTRLLDKACEIITALEDYADESLQKDIDALFNEIAYSDEVEDEMRMSADDEAQDWDTFGENKI
jgi:hypothetical protein